MYRFVADSVEGLGKKRKASQRACDQCRTKRRRCEHLAPGENIRAVSSQRSGSRNGGINDATGTLDNRSSVLGATPASSEPQPTAPLGDSAATPQAQLQFVGELSPTAVFQSSRASQDAADIHDSHSVGVWIDRNLKSTTSNEQASTSKTNLSSYKPAALQALLPYLSDTCSSLVPPENDFQALKAIYLAKIHPLCPILIEDSLQDATSKSETSCLKQAICIIASIDPSAKQHLRLSGFEKPLENIEFSRRLADNVRIALDLGLVTNDLILVQISALMSLYIDGPSGSIISAKYCSEAVYHAQTLGLHLSRPNSPSKHVMDRLFSCVWAIDRINAAINGRPVLLHECDLGVSLEDIISTSPPLFRVFLKVCGLLDRIISLYRPRYRREDDITNDEIPAFEDIVMKCEAADADVALLLSVEIFYHAVVVLSHRPRGSDRSIIPATQRHSAQAITSTVSYGFSSELSMWILMPYAVSLSLSTAYRELRHTQIPNNHRRARAAFQSNCELLEKLSPHFWSARAMAKVAEDTWREMMRASSRRGSAQYTSSPGHDLTRLQYVPDIDIFTRFDPDFNLDYVDDVLQGNLDLSLPWYYE